MYLNLTVKLLLACNINIKKQFCFFQAKVKLVMHIVLTAFDGHSLLVIVI